MAEVTKRDDPQLGDSVTRAKSVPAEEVAVASEENGNLNDEKKDPSAPAQPAEKKSLWAKTGLSLPLILIMAKGGLPPAIALAMGQATSVANYFTTLEYLIAIISIIGVAIMPRARFFQNMFINIVAVCLGAAFALLEIYCSVKARQHSVKVSPSSGQGSPTPGAALTGYNSSAAAVSAVWLFFQTYMINTLRAKYQAIALPSIVYSIFIIVSSTYAPQFPIMSAGISFVKKLMEAFLTGFAITTAVHVIVIPTSSRSAVFMDFTQYFGALQRTLQAHRAYFNSIEEKTGVEQTFTAKGAGNPNAAAVKGAAQGLLALYGKLQVDLPFAKREVALGNLTAEDLKEMNNLIRFIMLPILGLASMSNVYNRVAEAHGWTEEGIKDLSEEDKQFRDRILADWQFNMKLIHKPLDMIVDLMNEGMDHCMYQLRLKKPKKPKKAGKTPSGEDDVEAKAQSTKPGDKGFQEYFAKKCEVFHSGKQEALRDWCARKGVSLPADFFEHPIDSKLTVGDWKAKGIKVYLTYQRQLYMFLYMEYLLYHTSQAILDFIKYVDEKVENGQMSRVRLIIPGRRRLVKWAFSIFKNEDQSMEEQGLGDIHASATIVSMGSAYSAKKDPEHLPPTNAIEKIGNGIRKIPAFLRSPESAFGLRVAFATMSIGVLAFLHQTQAFFTANRLLWALIMVAISMTPTSGQSIFSFALRILGTIVAMILSFIVYYVPDGHSAGIIVFLWLFASCGFYIVIKFPPFTIIGVLSIVTMVLIIGYELGVRKLGVKEATTNGQKYLPIYELAPYRLATVVGGLAVAFIWTIFPYPITEHSALRMDLGKAMYLSANFYSVIHETVNGRIRRDEGDLTDKQSPGYRLQKVRTKIFSKTSLVLTSLREHLTFLGWEIPFGGKFPKKLYAETVDSIQRTVNYMALIGYASQTFTEDGESTSKWSEDFHKLMAEANLTTHDITMLLSLLSASVRNASALPPYLRAPKPFGLTTKLEELDSDILSVRHIAEPGYSAFAVIQICSRSVVAELEVILKNVKELVGELDFSYHIISTADSSTSTSTDNLFNPMKSNPTSTVTNGKEIKND